MFPGFLSHKGGPVGLEDFTSPRVPPWVSRSLVIRRFPLGFGRCYIIKCPILGFTVFCHPRVPFWVWKIFCHPRVLPEFNHLRVLPWVSQDFTTKGFPCWFTRFYVTKVFPWVLLGFVNQRSPHWFGKLYITKGSPFQIGRFFVSNGPSLGSDDYSSTRVHPWVSMFFVT